VVDLRICCSFHLRLVGSFAGGWYEGNYLRQRASGHRHL